MLSAATAFATALLAAVALTPLVRSIALDMGAVDQPHERHIHARPIPRLGGIALVLAFFLPLLLLFGLGTEAARVFYADPMRVVGLVVGGLALCALGAMDDLRGVRAWHKLWVQALVAVVAYACGFRIEAVSVPLFGHLDMGVFGIAVTAFWIVAIVNAVNLIDGLDGLAGGVVFFACLTNFVVGALNGEALVTLLSATLGGAVLGFLLFNFNPATIFMGDSGSMFLGYVLATTSILGSSVKSSTTVAILVPLIALGLPIMDTLFAMVRRFLERRPLFSPDDRHIHHRLLAMGITHRRAVLILYGVSIAFTTGAILMALGRDWQVGIALALLSIAVIGLIRSVGDFQTALRRWRRKERVRPAAVERLRRAAPDVLFQLRSVGHDSLASVLQRFGEATQMWAIELADGTHPRGASFLWCAEGKDLEQRDRELVTASYPVAAAGPKARLHFSWLTDQSEVLAEADILLQLIVDACEARITQTEAPRTAPLDTRALN